jgi:predicted nucleic acid-binding protein
VRVFVDANVLFSAAKSDGAVRSLLTQLLVGRHTLCVDAYVVSEARRNLERKGPESIAALEVLLGRSEVSAHRPHALRPELAALLPDKDQPVLAAAIRLRCEALVTGDRSHFGSLYGSTLDGVTIHSPRPLAEALLS